MTAGKMGIRAGCLAWAGLLMGLSTAHAQEAPALGAAPVVLEMFTAQGCAACPPADAIFSRYADRDGVIALALHVDYWDYLGWQDSFGKAAYTERQKAYARAASAKMIYTPQVIVGGADRLQGTQGGAIEAALQAQSRRPAPVRLAVRQQGAGAVTISAEALTPLERPAVLQLVRYRPSEHVSIEDGENAGQNLEYRNIVTDWQELSAWDGSEPFELTFEVSPAVSADLPLVLILQQEGHGRVLAATRLD